jgi:hypothetical protein
VSGPGLTPFAVPQGAPSPFGAGLAPASGPTSPGRNTIAVVAAVLVAFVALSGIGVAALLRWGSRGPFAAAPATPSTTSSTVGTVGTPTSPSSASLAAGVVTSPTLDAKFPGTASLPDACDLVTGAQVHQLVPRFSGTRGTASGGHVVPMCEWNAPGAGIKVILGDPPMLINATSAHDTFLTAMQTEKASDLVTWHYNGIGGEAITSGPGTAAEKVSGVGEEAFATDRYGRRGAQETQVTFRISNVIVLVIHADVTGKASRTTIRQRAVQMARWTADALKKRETP